MASHPSEPEPTVPFDRGQLNPATWPYPTQDQGLYPTQDQQPYPSQDQRPFLSQDQGPYPSQDRQPYPQAGYGGYPTNRAPLPDNLPGLTSPYGAPVDPRWQAYGSAMYSAQKSRVAAGLLALFLGCLGIHNFYLGRTGIGLLQLLLTVLSLGFLAPFVAIWVLVEAILIFTRSPSFVTDAKGIPLGD